ncbi:hypothetical protein BJY24_001875 [Nocardia transvalensis]|uniref:mannan endo-1,4-beta-mannosidase n=1 Tax=Nocardia transvalensis TaxID=37333 RepID=A0A7W9UH58_9NOCA|nr:hypothetical protein [Nocardia transvalensis]MBB5913008.1 hypothetical protein [Nocardia transvalensis]
MRIRYILVAAAAILGALVTPAGPESADAGADPGAPAQRSSVAGVSAGQFRDGFVRREGSALTVAGQPFRFSGANIEWLGLMNYGPNPSAAVPAGSERYPTEFEVDDAFATAREMGATVIRSQTLGDTVGCPSCLEPALGQFNPDAFAHMDMVVAKARAHGLKLIGEFSGDADGAPSPDQNSPTADSHDWYCTWRNRPDCGHAFFTDPDLIGDYERHMRAVLEHVNPLTGLAYKDDPTFAGWVDGNNLDLLDGVPMPVMEDWLRTVSDHFHAIAPRQLFVNISLGGGDGFVTDGALRIPGIDIYAAEYYPHWLPIVSGGNRIDGNAPSLHDKASQVAAAGKSFAVIEFGWDRTDFLTPDALRDFATGLENDPNIAGDNFWALQAHATGHGWQPIPADTGCSPTCEWGEDGNWWALYYTGITTASHDAADMAARAQLLRTHSYAMAGYPVPPPHDPVPAPTITSADAGTVLFEGAAGARDYSIQRQDGGGWSTVCDHCVTDASGGWHDPDTASPGCYRVVGYNLDGVEGMPSRRAGICAE